MAKMTSPADMIDAVTDSMKERTGKTLEEWVEAVQAAGIDSLDQKAVRKWLKTEHGVLQNSQWAIADAAARVAGWVRPSVEDYIDSQYQGEKVTLRPIFDTLREIIEELGKDVSVEGRGGYTPFVRKRQFAAVQASTKTRIDLGLRFKEAPTSELLSNKSLPGQSTHKVSLTSLEDITNEVRDLIRMAYEQNG
jgi:predicted transport protein